MNFICRSVSFVMMLAGSSLFLVSCSEKTIDEAQREKIRQERLEREARLEAEHEEELAILKKEQELELAKQKAAEAALKAKALEEELLLKQQEAAQQLADEKERQRQLEIEGRQEEQRLVLEEYVGTKYDELTLEDGRVLKSVKVTRADAIGVSFMHQSGVARVEFTELSEDVRDACLYDEELAALEVERQQSIEEQRQRILVEELANKKAASNREKTSSKREKTNRSTRESSSAKNTPPKAVKPRGKLSVRAVGSGQYGKKVEIRAKANVSARITLDGVYQNGYYVTRSYSVSANKAFSVVVSRVKSKYSVTLSGGGKLLDSESSGRKTGLRERHGL